MAWLTRSGLRFGELIALGFGAPPTTEVIEAAREVPWHRRVASVWGARFGHAPTDPNEQRYVVVRARLTQLDYRHAPNPKPLRPLAIMMLVGVIGVAIASALQGNWWYAIGYSALMAPSIVNGFFAVRWATALMATGANLHAGRDVEPTITVPDVPPSTVRAAVALAVLLFVVSGAAVAAALTGSAVAAGAAALLGCGLFALLRTMQTTRRQAAAQEGPAPHEPRRVRSPRPARTP